MEENSENKVSQYEYNIETKPIASHQKIHNNESNKILLPLHEDTLEVILEALNEYQENTKYESYKEIIEAFLKALECIGDDNLAGRVTGYYTEGYVTNHKTKEKIKVNLEIKTLPLKMR